LLDQNSYSIKRHLVVDTHGQLFEVRYLLVNSRTFRTCIPSRSNISVPPTEAAYSGSCNPGEQSRSIMGKPFSHLRAL
jgi:hypothetical protein